MNDLLYYGPLADLLETDATYQKAAGQTKFGYLTLLASFHWNVVKLLGNVSPQYKLAPAQAPGSRWLVKLPYLDEALVLHIEIGAPSPDDWLAYATATLLAEVHADCMDSVLCAKSADAASTLLSNIGHTVVIRVLINALRLANRKTVDPGALEEAISTLCLLSHRRYEGRVPEIAIVLGNSSRRPGQKNATYFGRQFLSSKKSAVLFRGGKLLLRCLGNARIVEIVDLATLNITESERPIGSLERMPILEYAYRYGAISLILTNQGEVLVGMGARICFAWNASGWSLYPAMQLFESLETELKEIGDTRRKRLATQLARRIALIVLTLRENGLGALIVVSQSEAFISRSVRNTVPRLTQVEGLFAGLFVGRHLCKISPQLMCNAAGLDGAVLLDQKGIIRGIGCILETDQSQASGEGTRTRAALCASRNGIAIKLSQDGDISFYKDGKREYCVFSPTL